MNIGNYRFHIVSFDFIADPDEFKAASAWTPLNIPVATLGLGDRSDSVVSK